MTETGVDYELDGGTLRVVGMSDLGKPAGDDVDYDDCYAEDGYNYIDTILVGNETAARGLTHIEIPARDGYLPFYNSGGPGPEPTEGVRYTAPGPPDLEPIINALDDPMRVSYEDRWERVGPSNFILYEMTLLCSSPTTRRGRPSVLRAPSRHSDRAGETGRSTRPNERTDNADGHHLDGDWLAVAGPEPCRPVDPCEGG